MQSWRCMPRPPRHLRRDHDHAGTRLIRLVSQRALRMEHKVLALTFEPGWLTSVASRPVLELATADPQDRAGGRLARPLGGRETTRPMKSRSTTHLPWSSRRPLEAGTTNVDPSLSEIRVTFSKEMLDKSWSWSTASKNTFPKVAGEIHYLEDRRTCVLPVKLEPGRDLCHLDQFRPLRQLQGSGSSRGCAVPAGLQNEIMRRPLSAPQERLRDLRPRPAVGLGESNADLVTQADANPLPQELASRTRRSDGIE